MTRPDQPARVVLRNYTYVAFGLGIDVLLTLVTLISLLGAHSSATGALVVTASMLPFLALGARAAMIGVACDARGVRVINLWRTHRLAWREVAGFAVSERNLERFGRRGRIRAFIGLACVRRADGSEVTISAISAAGSLAPPSQFVASRLPGLIARLAAAAPTID